MIRIERGSTNPVALTLAERVTISPVAFVFKFVGDQSGIEKVFAAEDQSSFTDRYNFFEIVEDDVEDLHAGTVSLEEGYHHYYVYQVDPATPTTITLDGTETLLEQGKALVTDASTPPVTYYTENDGENNVVYNG